jgi:hypothetical protein
MNKQDLFNRLTVKERNLKQIAELAVGSPGLVKYLFSGIKEEKAHIKYGCNNTLLIISEKAPELLYPHFEIFKAYLSSENKFIKWTAILIIANLTRCDNTNNFDAIFNSYFSEITGPVMITAANIIKGAAVIAKAKPYRTEGIIHELFKIKDARYQTNECLNIVIGHTITSFDKFFEQISNKREVLDFVKDFINNSRTQTRNKAEKFIKKWDNFNLQSQIDLASKRI